MTQLFIRHKVKDYDNWKEGFDSVLDFRTSNGAVESQVYRDPDDSNNITVITKFDNIDAAKKFAGLPELKEKMTEIGVLEEPTVFFLEEAA